MDEALPVISDFGNAVRGEQGVCSGVIQPDAFRAPETSFGMSWSHSVGHIEFCVCVFTHAFVGCLVHLGLTNTVR